MRLSAPRIRSIASEIVREGMLIGANGRSGTGCGCVWYLVLVVVEKKFVDLIVDVARQSRDRSCILINNQI